MGTLAGTIFQIVFSNSALCRRTHLGHYISHFHGLLRNKHDESLGMQWVIIGNSYSNVFNRQDGGCSQMWIWVLVSSDWLWVWFWILVHLVSLGLVLGPIAQSLDIQFSILVGVSCSLPSLWSGTRYQGPKSCSGSGYCCLEYSYGSGFFAQGFGLLLGFKVQSLALVLFVGAQKVGLVLCLLVIQRFGRGLILSSLSLS